MDLELTDEQRLIRDTVREFAQAEIAPRAREVDENERFPLENFAGMAELGLMGLPIPEKYGGAGADTVSYALAVEEISAACGVHGADLRGARLSGPVARCSTSAPRPRSRNTWCPWREESISGPSALRNRSQVPTRPACARRPFVTATTG